MSSNHACPRALVLALAALGLATAAPARAEPADDGQWTMAAKDYASTRYSAPRATSRHTSTASSPPSTVDLPVFKFTDDQKEVSVERITSTKDVDWSAVSALFAEVGWGDRPPEHIRAAFEKSSYVIFMYQDNELVGFGRTMDDGRYYAMLVDVVVKPSCQGKGIGREIVTWLRQQLDGYKFVTLTAAVGKDDFYLRLGWSRQRSAMIWPVSDQQRDAHALAD